jgi:hypothetical protein
MPIFRIHTDEKQPIRKLPVVTADFFSDGYCGIDEVDRKQIERWCKTAAVGDFIDTESVSVVRISR